jgi:hypothetical protein
MKTTRKFGFTIITFIFFFVLSDVTESLHAQTVRGANPAWAPAFYPGVRYYYFPDIETYYDLENQDFIYLDDGQWFFSYQLPPIFSGFDLYNAFIIALDIDVFQPWMHHHFYVSNYPRFYYRSLYRGDEFADIRGFNENEHKPFFATREERERMNQLNRNSNIERRSENIDRRPENVERRVENSRPPQKVHYYGRNIGQPVRVLPQMRENRQSNERRGKR